VAEESTTPDLAELWQRSIDALNARDFDAVLSFFAPHAVWESPGVGVFEGHDAIRGFIEDWRGAYEDLEFAVEEIRDLGGDVGFSVAVQRGRMPGSTEWVKLRSPVISILAHGLVERVTVYTDIDEARAAAERLAQERG
jgi:uncharacterized protein (TIGR02246 family)